LTDRSFYVARKMGLFSIPLAVVVMKLFYDWLSPEGFDWHSDFPRFVAVYLIMCVAKKLNTIFLNLFVYNYREHPVLDVEKYEALAKKEKKD
jgi:hypothetical protein